MEEKAPGEGPDVAAIFERARVVVSSILREMYVLEEPESFEAEQDLRLWFHRLGRRSGLDEPPAPPHELRLTLLRAACQYAWSYQHWKVGGADGVDPKLAALMKRDPHRVAEELERDLPPEPPQ